MTLHSAKIEIASHAARLAREIAKGGHADQMNRGGVASWMRAKLVAEYAPKPARASLAALAARLCEYELTAEQVLESETEVREAIAIALVNQAVDFEALLAAHPARIAPRFVHAARRDAAWNPARLNAVLAAARA